MKTNKFCQSCGMPIKKDPQNGGIEKDGSKNEKYCSYCYVDGEFTSPEIDTPQKMQAFCIEKMKEQGMPRPIAWIFTRGIPKLERWKK
ncbi:MAG: zinc ribbon domain-containing protein [Methanobacteriaceae archaeon]|nr:zinc ribbon domain-containing protein [Methanobacteriaceae archaeon]